MTTDATGAAGLSGKAVLPLRTLSPEAATDDLEWLDRAVGGARVVAIGESAHYNAEFYQLRHRVLRHLVERHGFSAYAMESGYAEGQLADAWVRGGEERLGHVMAQGTTSLMGLWQPLGAQLEWMRRHNRTAARPVGFHGIDMPGSMASLLPGLDAVLAYLADADPGFGADPRLRETAAAFAGTSAFSAPAAIGAYVDLAPERKDALTAGLADLTARMTGRRLDHLRHSTAGAHARALRTLHLTVTLDAMLRALSRGEAHAMMLSRSAALADTVEWVLRGGDRIVLGAHNLHVQRWPATLTGTSPATTMGMHLADRLGEEYVVIGTTTATGETLNTGPDFYEGRLFTELAADTRPDSLDAVMAATHDGPFATDLRRLSPADATALRAVSRQRFGAAYSGQSPLDAYDALVHLPHVTAAEPDRAALAHAPRDVREAFARWRPAEPARA
ncbi:erythromycin esterase family protein [Streptomyces iconiensis]|uniref:Erythromycin esterase family protein n=1 Tax=Streptomyces iconiensis TaxID=1384038 RepID=A0ABT6ZWJ4_9ACTN|nr:erythromycin esterase family protein [Streptomyces iconiensis]MDJ1133442.1 erythromycin esterase family protein [Streptomyces iconiensis]